MVTGAYKTTKGRRFWITGYVNNNSSIGLLGLYLEVS
jgi:hypothetical protein